MSLIEVVWQVIRKNFMPASNVFIDLAQEDMTLFLIPI